MRGSDQAVSQMPRLDALDEEFARERVAILLGQRRRKLRFAIPILVVALGAVVGLALTRHWVSADWRLLSEVQALLPISRNAASDTSAEEIDRLVREVASLKEEIADLTEERQQAAGRIASLEAAAQEPRNHPATVYWYSDLAALTYQSPFPSRSTGGQTEGRQR